MRGQKNGYGRLKCFIGLLNSYKNVTIIFSVSKNPYLHLNKYYKCLKIYFFEILGARETIRKGCGSVVKKACCHENKNANMFNFVQYGLKYHYQL